MSENKDLEIIKSEVDFLDKYMADHELDERLNAILVHAERMAAEIERLKKFIEDIYNNDAAFKKLMTSYEKISKSNAEYRDEITRLKAELEKRPEVIYCGTCKYYVPNENFCNAGLLGKVSPFDFCFRGQRRESKEGK